MHKPVDNAEALAREVLAQTLESHQLNSSAYYVRDSQGIRLTGVIAMEAMLAHSAALVAENENLRHVVTNIEAIMREGVKDNDGPNRVWIDGIAHEGPVSDFVIRVFMKLGQVCRTALETRNG